jgi:hypothetical protein
MTNIKIFPKVYVGFQGRRGVDEVPLGFLTPYTDDQAGQKRRDTVDAWAKGRYGGNKTFNSVELDNEPMIGFEVGRSIRRSGGWNGSGASYVRVKDPRGFELEITIENLVMIMNENLIDNGEIMAECVWGRDGNRNILLPTNSEPYKASKQMAKSLSEVISLKEVKPGDMIKLIDGTEGMYLGGMYALYRRPYYYYDSDLYVSNKRYVIAEADGNLVGRTTLKVSEIVKKADKKLTPAEIETKVRDMIKTNPACCRDESYSTNGSVRMWMCKDKFTRLSVNEIVKTEDEAKVLDASDADVSIFAVNKNGKVLLLRDSGYDVDHHLGNTRNYHTYVNRNYTQVSTTGPIGLELTQVGFPFAASRHGSSDTTHYELVDVARYYTYQIVIKTAADTEVPIIF